MKKACRFIFFFFFKLQSKRSVPFKEIEKAFKEVEIDSLKWMIRVEMKYENKTCLNYSNTAVRQQVYFTRCFKWEGHMANWCSLLIDNDHGWHLEVAAI